LDKSLHHVGKLVEFTILKVSKTWFCTTWLSSLNAGYISTTPITMIKTVMIAPVILGLIMDGSWIIRYIF